MEIIFTRTLYRLIICGLLLTVTKPASAQTDIDGLMMEKRFFCVGPTAGYSSWKNYWEGTLKKREPEYRQGIHYQLYAYG